MNMTHDEWSKKIRIALIEHDMTTTQGAVAIGYSPEWFRQTLYGRNIKPNVVKAASDYFKVENYLEDYKEGMD